MRYILMFYNFYIAFNQLYYVDYVNVWFYTKKANFTSSELFSKWYSIEKMKVEAEELAC